MGKQAASVDSQVLARIRQHGPEMRRAARTHIRDVLGPALEQQIRHALPSTSSWKLEADADDPDAQTLLAERAIRDGALFGRVAAHRAVFFRRSRDAQASFAPGSLRIVPTADRLAQWRRDYDAMRESMFFGEVPDFAEILTVVSRFEEDFNSPRRHDAKSKPQP